ncbi:Coatomer subunit delta [Gracilariopsis chorda]|uniref:Coatomer subunit delta n=1 Tax=Gracilariopsis chorda TaxID=448386 RepID=A0A2V3J606_9FLOR|nr:Coatomer subunit delta [Gracilariopsis chorda]|eukprot:PXF49839.1 Coatomer subunit delta [Gracilariopsis chorda]
MEVKGDLMLRITDSSKAAIRLQVSTGGGGTHRIQFRTHPSVDRTLFSTQGIVGLKDPKRLFPTDNSLGVLRWHLATKDESEAPLLNNCWPSDSGDESVVNIEYELGANKEFRDVVIAIPILSGSQRTVSQCDGEFVYSLRSQSVEWHLAVIDQSNSQESLEFSLGADDAKAFFPINVGPSGIMLDEYKNGLERLRDRLGLSKEDADAAFNKVVKQRMLVYVNKAISQLEKRSHLRGQSEERDVGDDPNIKRAGAVLGIDAGSLPIELSNLVDFYVHNGFVIEQEIEAEGENRTFATYPVTLRGDLQPKVYNQLYKNNISSNASAPRQEMKSNDFFLLPVSLN